MFFVRSSRGGGCVWGMVVTVLTAVAGLSMPRAVRAQSAPTAGDGAMRYVYLRGNDTIATEAITIDPRAIVGVLDLRGQVRIEWQHVVSADGVTLGPLNLSVFAPGSPSGSPAIQRFVFTQAADSMVMEGTASGLSQRKAAPSRSGTTPLINQSALHMALITSMARKLGRSTLPIFTTNDGQTMDLAVAGAGDSTVSTLAGLSIVTEWRDGAPHQIRLAAQRLRIVRTESASSVAPSPTTLSYAAPADAPYMSEDVIIPTPHGFSLAGTLTRPRGARGPVPVVVTISGSGPQDRDSRSATVRGYAPFRDFADTLGRRGIAVLRYDDRGVGASGGRGALRDTATSADFADDVASVVAYLRTRQDVDPRRIALAGHSEGGIIAPMIAARDSGIAAVVLIAAPAEKGRDIAKHQIRIMLDADSLLPPAQRDSIIGTVPGRQDVAVRTADPWTRFWLTYDPIPALQLMKQPVLILQGATDTQVPVDQAGLVQRALRESGNSKVTVRVFPEVNHLLVHDTSGLVFNYGKLRDLRVRGDVRGALADWLVQTLRR
ncbi:MAG: hypothetical protein C0516_00530 [Gemmatimonas sp.]|nr:hypothetical protein [Gemmatimonas sp.]